MIEHSKSQKTPLREKGRFGLRGKKTRPSGTTRYIHTHYMYMYICDMRLLYMYMYMYICMYICMYVCMHAGRHACMHVFLFMYVCMYVCMYV